LALRHVAFVPDLADVDRAVTGTTEAARSLATFVGADPGTVERVTPSALRAPLRRALAAGSAVGGEGRQHVRRPPRRPPRVIL
jgi:hypothetical protein